MNERRSLRRSKKNVNDVVHYITPNLCEDRVSRMIDEARSRQLIKKMTEYHLQFIT